MTHYYTLDGFVGYPMISHGITRYLVSLTYDGSKVEDSLKRALGATIDPRRQVEWGARLQNIDSELEYIEMLIGGASQEFHDIRPE